MKLTDLKPNPDNPFPIKGDESFLLLKENIKKYPKFLELRPIIYDPKTMVIMGGNKRYMALMDLGHEEIPKEWAVPAAQLTEEEKHTFILADNIGFGQWDMDRLLEGWEDEFEGWGIESHDILIDYYEENWTAINSQEKYHHL